MDLKDAWKGLGHQPQNEQEMEAILTQSPQSHALVTALRRGLGIKLLWIIFFVVVLSGLIFLFKDSNVRYFLGAGLIYMVMGLIFLYPKYRQIPRQVNMGQASLTLLKEVRTYARDALRLETTLGKWFMPIFPIIGFAITLPEERISWDNISENPWIVLFIVIGAIVIGYFANKLGARMNQFAFGSDLDHLDQLIDELETTS